MIGELIICFSLAGFSRGALSARLLGEIIFEIGIYQGRDESLLIQMWDSLSHNMEKPISQNKVYKSMQSDFKLLPREAFQYLGLWDTVSAIGLRKLILTKSVDIWFESY